MIGVIAKSDEKNIVREFFELFKTPWEFYEAGNFYDVLICTGEVSEKPNANLIVLYNTEKVQIDSFLEVELLPRNGPEELVWNGITFPVYKNISELECEGIALIKSKASGKASVVKINRNQQKIVRIGYDLFREVAFLISSGQPVEYAEVPTLEIHIAILREIMITAGVPFIEISPVPYGYDFITCLTHDIDFTGIRNHKLDHTMFGFLYRAVVRTFFDALRRKVPWQKLWKNLKAALLLPAVYTGIASDFWARFDKYLEIEKGLRSTFFFLPHKGMTDDVTHELVSKKRAGKYDIRDHRMLLLQILSEGCEIGLHGIDAWYDPEKGKRESDRITSVLGKPVSGVRIHWLYFNNDSPGILEKAGLNYDSTYGYNEAVGFFAGTAQVFKPPGSEELLELPMIIQDTAMFLSGRMGVREDVALTLCRKVIKNVSDFGGALVINWHGRSLEPERLWEGFYIKLLNEIKSRRIWFGTGSEVTQWFNKRRLVRFSRVNSEEGILRIRLEGLDGSTGPDLNLKIYVHCDRGSALQNSGKKLVEKAIHEDTELEFKLTQP